jgi:hypothetical protein
MLTLIVWKNLGFAVFGWVDWILRTANILFTMLSVGKIRRTKPSLLRK